MDSIYSLKDLKLTIGGDLVVGPDGDLQVVSAGETVSQDIMVRLKTYRDESPLMPGMGCRISDYAGYPNTRETGDEIETEVIRALTDKGYVSKETLYVRVVPVRDDEGKLLLVVDPDDSTQDTLEPLEFDIDLTSGDIS